MKQGERAVGATYKALRVLVSRQPAVDADDTGGACQEKRRF